MKGGWDGDVGVQKCCKMSILSHDPMGSWGIPWDVHQSLLQMHVHPTFDQFHDPMESSK